MTSSFSALKKSGTSVQTLQKQIETLNKSPREADDRYWQPTVDKNGNGSALIRFLPPSKGENTPWVRIWSHGFKGPTGQWYIENSLTTLDKKDPVSELNSKLWNSGGKDSPERKQATDQKRKLNYISNIYVINDPGNPENNGKVFLFKYGKKIFDKIEEAINPPEDPLEPKDPFDPFSLWEGANFKMTIRKVEGYRNYDKSEFQTPGPLADDAKLEKIWNAQYPLQPEIDVSKFKTYDELAQRLAAVLGENAAPATNRSAGGRTTAEFATSKADNGDEKDDSPPWDTSTRSAGSSVDADDIESFKQMLND